MPTEDPVAGARGRGRVDPLAVVAILAVAVGTVLRFVAPGPLWLDEALSANIAGLAPGEALDALRRDGHPPLYYLALHGWMAVVGEGDVAVRALSGIVSVAGLPLAYLVGLRRGGRPLALASLALVAMSPFVLRYATETRMYALVMVEVLAAWLLVEDRRAGRPGRWRGPLLALVAAALVLTHYWGLFLVATVVAVLAASAAWSARQGAPWRGDAATAGWVALGGAGFAVWLPSFLDQLGSTGTPWAPPVRPSAALGITFQDLAGGGVPDAVVGVALLGAVLLLALTARPAEGGGSRMVVDLRTVPGVRDVAAVALVTLVGGATVAWVGGSTFASRYASVVVPLVVVAAATGAVRVPGPRWRAGVVAVLCLLGVVGAADQLASPRTQVGEVADAVAAVARPGDVVLYCPDQLGPAGERVLPEGLDQVVYPTLARPELVDWTDYAERMAASDPDAVAPAVVARAGADRAVFVVANPGYRSVDERCDEVRDAVAVRRGPGQRLVERDGERFWESAGLTWFPAP
jgi:hypothetical protein